MKHLALLFLVGLVFMAYGVATLDDYSIAIEGPPPQEGLPELLYGKSDHLVPATRELLDSTLPERSLVYKFQLPPGTFDYVRWEGHGILLPPTLSVRDDQGREVASLKVSDPKAAALISPFTGPLLLPERGFFSLLAWLLGNGWTWALAVIFFFAVRAPFASLMQKLIALPADRFALGGISGKNVLLATIALAGVWIAFIVPGAIRFDVGDDPAMEILASGQVSGQPSEYLVFINVLIGLVLKGLYLLLPQVPWYPVVLGSTVILSLIGILLVVLQDDLPDRFCWLCLFGTVFGIYFVTHLQFTSAAYLLGLLGMLIFLQGTSLASLLLAMLAVAGGSLLRFESFLLLVATTAAAVWLGSRRRVAEKAAFFSAIVLLAGAGKAFDQYYYDRQPGWRDYRTYNAFRGDLNMTAKLNDSERNRPVYRQVGWSENDFNMFARHWLFEDPAAFTADKLAHLDRHLSSNRTGFDLLISLTTAIVLAPAPAFLFLVILMHKTENRNLSLLKLAAIVGPVLIILGYLALTARLPARVAVPPLFAASLLLLLANREEGRTCRALAATPGLPIIFVTLAVISLTTARLAAAKNENTTTRLLASLKLLTPYADKTLVSSINAVQLERLDPLTGLAQTQNLNIIHLMWSGGSPSFQLQLQRHGSNSLFQSLAFNPNFWLMIPTSQWDRANSFSLYMDEHYHQKIKMIPVILSDGKPAVFPDFAVMQAVRETRP